MGAQGRAVPPKPCTPASHQHPSDGHAPKHSPGGPHQSLHVVHTGKQTGDRRPCTLRLHRARSCPDFRSGTGCRQDQENGVRIRTELEKSNRTPLPFPRQRRANPEVLRSPGEPRVADVERQNPALSCGGSGCVTRACATAAHAQFPSPPPPPLHLQPCTRLAYLAPTLPCPPSARTRAHHFPRQPIPSSTSVYALVLSRGCYRNC